MVSKEVSNYLSTRYPRFREYADYHAGLAKLDQQGGDVLNEVLLSFLQKDEQLAQKLYNKKGKGGYREIDFYILRMVKLNCHSATSPYRFRYKGLARDENSECLKLDEDCEEDNDPIDEPYEEVDKSELICQRFQLIRKVLESLPIPEKEKEIFIWKFFQENSWREWRGKEKTRQLQAVFKEVKAKVIYKIAMLKLAYTGIVARSSYKTESIKNEYKHSLFPAAYRYSRRYLKAASVKCKYEQLLNQITGNHEA